MKAYMRSGGTATFILNLGNRWRLVVSLTFPSLYSGGKQAPVPVDLGVGWGSEPFCRFGEEKNVLPHLGLQGRIAVFRG